MFTFYKDNILVVVACTRVVHLLDQLCSIIQARIYPELLTAEEVKKLHEDSRWEDGKDLRQCAFPDYEGFE